MPAAAFALILLSASYLWLRRWRLSRSHLQRTSGHALYFFVVAAAVPVGIWTGLVLRALGHVFGDWQLPARMGALILSPIVPTDISAQVLLFGIVSVCALPASILLAALLNAPLPFDSRLTARLLLRLGSLEELEHFLWATSERGLSTMITTASGKVYIGNSLEMPTGENGRRFLRIEPQLSGFRNDHQEFEPTTSYAWIDALPADSLQSDGSLCKRDFDVLIPVDSVTSVHSFDIGTFAARKFSTTPTQVENSTSEIEGGFSGSPLSDIKKSVPTPVEWVYFFYVISIWLVPFLCAVDYYFLSATIFLAGVSCAAIAYYTSRDAVWKWMEALPKITSNAMRPSAPIE